MPATRSDVRDPVTARVRARAGPRVYPRGCVPTRNIMRSDALARSDAGRPTIKTTRVTPGSYVCCIPCISVQSNDSIIEYSDISLLLHTPSVRCPRPGLMPATLSELPGTSRTLGSSTFSRGIFLKLWEVLLFTRYFF